MKNYKKSMIIIGLAMSWAANASANDSATDCPLHKRVAEARLSIVNVAATPRALENPQITPISTASSPDVSLSRENLPASPPFEATDRTPVMAAGAEAVIAPSQTVLPPAPLSQSPIQVAQAPMDTPVMTPAKQWNDALQSYVKTPDADGLARFDYAGLKASSADMTALGDYIASLESKNPDDLSEKAAIAYWANLYNAVTIQVVADAYPVSTIKKVQGGLFNSGPWKKDLISVNNKTISLDDVEHKILRKQYPSPLVHYMVNCASVGCPNLKDGLWSAETLDADRAAAARAYINSPRGAKVTDKGLVVSSIYDWFQEDFGGNKAGVLAHLSDYAEGDLKEAIDGGIKISGYDYDWSLNE